MKKFALVALVLVISLLAVASVASAEHDNIGGVGVKSMSMMKSFK
ncbi:MAG: hypothetical protein K0R39_1245 [Symbiobacteriaceae bacterium]|jgi:hypothetical protein|nr:hypothetical protein [Symbiobacteriaceae bacterium]